MQPDSDQGVTNLYTELSKYDKQSMECCSAVSWRSDSSRSPTESLPGCLNVT
jgi:hypothetical protein